MPDLFLPLRSHKAVTYCVVVDPHIFAEVFITLSIPELNIDSVQEFGKPFSTIIFDSECSKRGEAAQRRSVVLHMIVRVRVEQGSALQILSILNVAGSHK